MARRLGHDGACPADPPGRGPSVGPRSAPAARAGPPRTPGRGGGRRRRPRAGPARPSGSRARTGRRSRAPSPSGRAPSASSRPACTGVGRKATFGRSSRAAFARFTNRPTRNGSLVGRWPAVRGDSTPEATSTPTAGMSRSAVATFAAVSPPARVTGTSRAIGDGRRRIRADARAAGVHATGRIEQEAGHAAGELRPGGLERRADLGVADSDVDGRPRGPWRGSERRDGLAAVVLDRIRVGRGDGRLEGRRVRVRRDQDDGRGMAGRRGRPDGRRQLRRLPRRTVREASRRRCSARRRRRRRGPPPARRPDR